MMDYLKLVQDALNTVGREYRYYREVEIVDRIREEINRRVIAVASEDRSGSEDRPMTRRSLLT